MLNLKGIEAKTVQLKYFPELHGLAGYIAVDGTDWDSLTGELKRLWEIERLAREWAMAERRWVRSGLRTGADKADEAAAALRKALGMSNG